MAKKKGRGGGKGRSKGSSNDMLKQEQILQAVLLADSFKVNFRPFTLNKPKVLLPLVNVPLINYTIEFLASNGVQEIFVLCAAHSKQVQQHIKTSIVPRYSAGAGAAGVKFNVILCENCHSAGDALRHIEQMRVLKSDFVLIGGDVVSNLNLQSVLEGHRARKKQDKLNIMTMVMKQAAPRHRTRGHDDRSIVLMDSDSKQLLMYDNDTESSRAEIDVTLLSEHPTLDLRHDLMDTHIYICSLDVLALLNENFDWQDLRQNLVKGILEDAILGNKVFAHTISGEYAARVQDPKSYHAISKDVVERWTYPMVPENNLIADTTYRVYRHNVYREAKISVSMSVTITSDTVIGYGTSIGTGCVIDRCIIGRNVSIGAGSKLSQCHIWDGCVVGKGVVLTKSVLADGVTLGDNAVVSDNCMLGYGVKVGKDCKVPPLARLCTTIELDDEEDEELQDLLDACTADGKTIVGSGTGIVYRPKLEYKDSDKYGMYCLVPAEADEWPSDDEDEDEDEDWEYEYPAKEDTPDEPSEESKGASEKLTLGDNQKGKEFEMDLKETLHRGIKGGLEVDGIVLEAGTLKLTHHAFVQDYYGAVFYAFFSLGEPQPVEGKKAAKATLKSITKIIKAWKPVVEKFCKYEADQMHMLNGLVQCCRKHREYIPVFAFALNLLYQWEFAEEATILRWDKQMQEEGGDLSTLLLAECSEILEYLKQESDEDESSSDDDDCDDDDQES